MSDTAYRFRLKDSLLGLQMLFIAFGALVLVPLLTGLDPGVSLFTAGAGTLLFQAVTKGKVPVFLASSFAFIGPLIYGVKTWGLPATLSGLIAAGVMYLVFGAVIRLKGTHVIERLLPPIVTGPVIILIGLILAPVAVNMALGKAGDGSVQLVDEPLALSVSMLSLAATGAAAIFGRGFVKLVPVMIGIGTGYALSLVLGIVDFSALTSAAWIRIPPFVTPEWNWEAVIFILPVAIAPAIEHFGDVLAIGHITGRNYVKDPGIHRTLIGDGLATILASFMGGPPNTTYSEVTGGVALTRAFNPAIMTWAAIAAVTLAFLGKLGGLLQTIPVPVMGGILILLFGMIAVVGLNTLVRSGEDLTHPRTMCIIAIILVFGVGGMTFSAGAFSLKGVGLAGLAGLVLNLVLPRKSVHQMASE